MRNLLSVPAIAIWCFSVGIVGVSAQVSGQGPPPAAQLANPASQNCARQGGQIRIEQRPDGGQYGVCVFLDNYQCEEWALFRGECRADGLRVTGYVTAPARYCAITGGRYTVVARSGASDEQGTCALPGGKTCDAAAYYAGNCSR